jgi:chitinase
MIGNQRDVSFIRTDSITHLYVAFGYISPGTYEIFPIPGSTVTTIFEIMQLKQNAPGLRIFLSLGGWSKFMSKSRRYYMRGEKC